MNIQPQHVKNIDDQCTDSPETRNHFSDIKGNSLLLKKEITIACDVAPIDATVLITGRPGTGKEIIAQGIHDASTRGKNDMIIVNCGGLPLELVQSEFLGYTKGTFTGATFDKKGYFEQAHNSTIFLDEIGDLPLAAQATLLRVIQEKTVTRVGATSGKVINFRLICATNKNLRELVDKRVFREDLFYRISVVPINLPSLKDRKNDILLLADFFLDHFCKDQATSEKIFTESGKNCLMKHDWPGNVRELRNYCERLVTLAKVDKISKSVLCQYISIFNDSPSIQSDKKIEKCEDIASALSAILMKNEKRHNKIDHKEFFKFLVNKIYIETNHNKSRAARILNIDTATLKKRLTEIGLK